MSKPTLSVTRDRHDTTRRAGYVIDGGKPGRDRLRVLSSALEPTTDGLLGRAGVSDATTILDLGCGGGDVTLTMATMAPRHTSQVSTLTR